MVEVPREFERNRFEISADSSYEYDVEADTLSIDETISTEINKAEGSLDPEIPYSHSQLFSRFFSLLVVHFVVYRIIVIHLK